MLSQSIHLLAFRHIPQIPPFLICTVHLPIQRPTVHTVYHHTPILYSRSPLSHRSRDFSFPPVLLAHQPTHHIQYTHCILVCSHTVSSHQSHHFLFIPVFPAHHVLRILLPTSIIISYFHSLTSPSNYTLYIPCTITLQPYTPYRTVPPLPFVSRSHSLLTRTQTTFFINTYSILQYLLFLFPPACLSIQQHTAPSLRPVNKECF